MESDQIKRYTILLVIFAVLASLSGANAATVEGYFHPGGAYGGHSGYYTWIDYCPMCHHHDCLLINPKGTYEGEITCAVCDADYDGCTGADKNGGGARAWLIPYEEPKSEPKPQPQQVPEPQPSQEDILKGMVIKHIDRDILWT